MWYPFLLSSTSIHQAENYRFSGRITKSKIQLENNQYLDTLEGLKRPFLDL